MFAQGNRVVPQAFLILCKEHILQSSAHRLPWLPGLWSCGERERVNREAFLVRFCEWTPGL